MDSLQLRIQDLSVSFKSSTEEDRHVVNKISFDLYKGQTLALVGESGSGKSVSAFSVLGLLPYPMAYHQSGAITYYEDNQEYQLLNKKEDFLNKFRGKKIGMIFQEPLSALNPLHTIEKQIGEPLQIHTTLTKKQIKDRVVDLLEMVEFKNADLNAYPHQLSGGQRQRVMIAQALSCNPKILIADEPTTALDVTIQAGIIDLLKKLSKTQNMTTLLISHDLHMVKKLADDVCVMKKGTIVEKGSTLKVLQKPQAPYTQQLINAEPSGEATPLDPHAKKILDVTDLTVTYNKKRLFSKTQSFCAVDHATFHLSEGETLGIVGESGSGKTTLVFSALKLIPSTGNIVFNNQNLHTLSKRELKPIRSDIQVIFQDPFGALNPRFTIQQIIEEGLSIHKKNISEDEKNTLLLQILEDVHLDADSLHRYPHQFSGGQRQRINIARSLILKPKLLALDEPTSALDRSIQAEILELLKQLQKKYNLSYLFISHDLAVVKSISHRIIVMKKGQIVEQGLTQNILSNPTQDYTKKLIEAAFT